MAGIDTILKSRLSKPELNRWSKGFTNVLNFAKAKNVPLVAIWSNAEECGHCIMLESCLAAKPFKTWMATSNCVFYFGCRRDTSKEDKYEGKGFTWCRGAHQQTTAFPFVRVYWKSGKLDWAGYGDQLDDNKDGTAGSKEVVKKLKSILKNFDPDSVNKDDIKLLSGSNSCTAQTDSDVVDNKDNQAIRSFWLNNNLSKKSYPNDAEGYCFNGWSSHSSNGSFGKDKGPAYGDKSAFSKIKALADQNGRPLFVIYGKANNKGTCFFNAGFNQGQRSSGSGNKFSRCQEGTFDPSLNVGNFGFYFVYYFNDKDETCAEANEVKQFITQFGNIKTGYPWYCAYRKYPDKHIYARYGSLNSKNVLAGSQSARESAYNDAFLPNMELVRSIGQEIQYVWTGGHQEEEVQYQTFQISFDLDGGTGQLQPLEVKTASDQGYVGSATLPSKTQVKAAVSKIGYEPSCFVDDFGNECRFGSEFTIAADTVLTIVWTRAEQNNNDSSSSHKKRTTRIGQVRAYAADQFPAWHTYSTTGYKVGQVSNNISSIQVIGEASGGPARNAASKQLVEAYLNDNVVEISPSCFFGCTQLTSVQNDSNVRIIGDYAFCSCSSLKDINFLQDGAHELCMVGDCAFMKSGLEKVNVYLKSSVSDTGYGVSCFAQCTALTSASLQGAPFLAGHMFDGCTNLKNITMANKHNYVYEYCFANCKSLTEITLPANLYMLSPHMFDGCANLKSVKFENGSILKQIGDYVFANCPKLTSIVLPESIDSIEYIDAEFLAGSSIDEVTFKGLSDDVFAVESRTYKHIDYTTGKIYDTGFNTMWKCINDNNIPAVLYLSKGRGEGCGRCECWYTNVEDKHKKDIANTQYLWFGGNYMKHNDEYSALKNAMSKLKLETPGTWIYIYLYWKKEDGTVVKWTSGSEAPQQNYWKNTLKPKMDNLFAGYEGQTQIEYVIDPTITTFGKGEGLSVAYISSTGNRWICTNDTVTKSADYRVDNYTVDNFKYGTWYGNIKELHEFAKANHIPLVAEWSSAGCDPCIDFRRRVWQSKEFQDEIRGKNCLFCRIEAESTEHFNTPGTQQHYISHVLGDPKKYIPQLVFYWLEPNGTEHKDIWVYDYRGDPANANYQTVLSKVDALTSTYTSSTDYSPILPNMSVNGKYQYYDNQSYDMNGQFFICDFKKSIQSYSDTKLSIDVTEHHKGVNPDEDDETGDSSDETYNVLDSIEVGQAVEIPNFTYQYYTTEDSASFADKYGVIFKADDQYYVDNKAIYLVDGVWEYKNGDAVSAEDLARKVLKTGIQYIYSFENYSKSETVIVDDDSSSYQTGKMIECTDSTPASSLDDILDFGGQSPEKLIVIVEMPAAGSSIEADLLEKKEFTKWMKDSGYLFIKVKSDSWSSNAPKALVDLEEYVKFDDNVVGSRRPKILVFKHCVNCSIERYGAIYCKKTIAYDQTKDVSYYTSLIDSYNKISE